MAGQHSDIDHTGLTGVGVGDATAHIADATDAHDASAISVLDSAANFTGTDVEAVLAELQDNIDGVSAGSGITSGTSFPVSPTTGDLFHRTDLGVPLWRYDGTRWLCTCLHSKYLQSANGATATTSESYGPVREEGFDYWLIDLVTDMFAASGLSGSAYWTWELYSYTTAGGTLRASATNQSLTNAQHLRVVTAIDALLGTTVNAVSARVVKTSTPGAFVGSAMMTYRLVGT